MGIIICCLVRKILPFIGSQERVHHCEDHNHLLKRITACLREGLILGIDLRYMREVLHDPSTGLTYEALTGKNKQSVPDCERLISRGVIDFLERKGHQSGQMFYKLYEIGMEQSTEGLSESERLKFC